MSLLSARTAAQNGEEPDDSDNGTAFAIKVKLLSGVPPNQNVPARSWGGARNSAARTSEFITLQQAQNVLDAARHSLVIGLPFTRHTTIHWEKLGVPDHEAARATGRYVKRMSDWLRTLGHEMSWIWARENGPGAGSHVHILYHLPRSLDLGSRPRKWLRGIARSGYRKGAIRTDRIGGHANTAMTSPKLHLANQEAVLGYLLKGTHPSAAHVLRLTSIRPQGVIIGRRVSTSENIGRTARARRQRLKKRA
jgi:hypothetical protein